MSTSSSRRSALMVLNAVGRSHCRPNLRPRCRSLPAGGRTAPNRSAAAGQAEVRRQERVDGHEALACVCRVLEVFRLQRACLVFLDYVQPRIQVRQQVLGGGAHGQVEAGIDHINRHDGAEHGKAVNSAAVGIRSPAPWSMYSALIVTSGTPSAALARPTATFASMILRPARRASALTSLVILEHRPGQIPNIFRHFSHLDARLFCMLD